MTQLAATPMTQRLINAAASQNTPIRNYEFNLMPSQSMEILREEEPQNRASPFEQNVTLRKARTPVRTNSQEDNNSTPNSSRRGSSIADKIRYTLTF